MTLTAELEAKIYEIKSTLNEAKSSGYQFNEAQTEFVIIDPVLHLLGYGPLQISKRGHDSVANNFPDYTLLPNTPHKWFLEAKRLDLSLQDGEAAQAVSYANHQGVDWAILTNGRSWYFYNAYLKKPLAEKRVMQINDLFADQDAIEKLTLLSKSSMQSGGLTAAWVYRRVVDSVESQLRTPNSAVRKQLRKIISEELGATVDEMTLGKAIASLSVIGPVASSNTIPPTPALSVNNGVSGVATAPPSPIPATGQAPPYTFAEIAKDTTLATFRKPQSLLFEDGHEQAIKTWADAAKHVVEYVGQTYPLPQLPFNTSQKGKKCFLNNSDAHGNGSSMLSHRIAQVGPDKIYIDTNRSTSDIAGSLSALLTAVGAPPAIVKVSIV